MCSHLGGADGCKVGVEVDGTDVPVIGMLCEIPRSVSFETWWRRWCADGLRARDKCVDVTAPGTADTVRRTHVLGLGRWGKTRLEGFRKDVPFEELGKRELRCGISKRDFPWLGSVPGLRGRDLLEASSVAALCVEGREGGV